MKHRVGSTKIIFLSAFAIVWEVTARFGGISNALLPPLSNVLIRLVNMIVHEGLLLNVAYSIGIIALTIFICLSVTLLMLALNGQFPWLKSLFNLLQAILSPLPSVAILPLVLVWFGVSRLSMVVVIIHAALWPMWSQLEVAVDKLHTQYGRFISAFHLPVVQKVYHVYFLGILPELNSALKVSWGRAWRALISVEMIFGIIGQQAGLGWLIYEKRMYMDTEGLYAGLIAIAFIGIIFESLIFNVGQNYEKTID